MFIYHIDELIILIGQYNTNTAISDYIVNFIKSSKLNNYLQNKYKNFINQLDINDIYNQQLIHCLPEEYSIMNKYLKYFGNYQYKVDNTEFVQYLIDNKPVNIDIRYALYDLITDYNKSLEINQNNIKIIDNINELINIKDKKNTKYKVKNIVQDYKQTILYINGSILQSTNKIHEELLDEYNNNYLKYENEWVINLNNIRLPLLWGTIIRNNIPCARLVLHQSNICECLICYTGDIYQIANKINKKLNCKVYSFILGANILIRNANKKRL